MNHLRGYSLVTLAYWGFTMTDGALRLLVLLHFHNLGFSPVKLAFLFLLYEFCGVITNLVGGWIGSRFGLRITLYLGLIIQIISLIALAQIDIGWQGILSVGYVMGAQALSGIAKDLTKMSSKSAVKLLAPESGGDAERGLFKWVAILTGSKNTLKGVGFFIGSLLLAKVGFEGSLYSMAAFLGIILIVVVVGLREEMGRSKTKVKLSGIFSKSREINLLSIARFFLFASRDIWFVVALPVFLKSKLDWSFEQVGGFMAAWVIGYGIAQALVPVFAKNKQQSGASLALSMTKSWGLALFATTAAIPIALNYEVNPLWAVIGGLAIFGVVFAVNSSLHSFLILSFSDRDKVSLNVGFYYMANAIGRLVGTLLSGLVYLWGGLVNCLWISSIFVLIAALMVFFIKPPQNPDEAD